MKSENVSRLSLTAFIFLALQYTLYKMAHMHPSPDGGILSVIAYQFECLMVLTLSVGVYVPLSLWLEARSGKPHTAWFYGIILFLLTITGFVLFSYARISRMENASKVTAGDSFLPVPQSAAKAVANFAQFVDSEIQLEKSEEVLRIVLKFRNTSQKEITQMDYIFVALQNSRIFYRINIRDSFLIPPGKTGNGLLTWDRSKFKDPALFDRMRSTLKAKTLRVYAKPSRVVFIDGTSLNET